MRSFSKPEKITQATLKALLHYDPETGVFTRLVKASNNTKVGDVIRPSAGAKGYVRFRVCGESHFGHRLAWLYMTGEWPEAEVDHENKDRGDNRWANLRKATFKQNRENLGLNRNNTSGFRGVSWFRPTGKWWARIGHNGKRVSLGHYNDLLSAVAARMAAERAMYTHSPLLRE